MCMRSNIKPVGKKTASPTTATSRGQRMGKTCLLSNMGDGRHDGRDSERAKTLVALALCLPGPLLPLEELFIFLIKGLTSYYNPGTSGLFFVPEHENL